AVDRHLRPLLQDVVVEDLERRPLRSVAGQAQMRAPYLGAGNPRSALEIRPPEVTLRGNRGAAELLLVESRQRSPIRRDQVRVAVLRARDHGHSLSLAPQERHIAGPQSTECGERLPDLDPGAEALSASNIATPP